MNLLRYHLLYIAKTDLTGSESTLTSESSLT